MLRLADLHLERRGRPVALVDHVDRRFAGLFVDVDRLRFEIGEAELLQRRCECHEALAGIGGDVARCLVERAPTDQARVFQLDLRQRVLASEGIPDVDLAEVAGRRRHSPEQNR